MSTVFEDSDLNSDIQFRLMVEADLEAVLAIEEAIHPFPWTYGIFHDCLNIQE